MRLSRTLQLPLTPLVLSRCYILRIQFESVLIYFQSAIHSFLCDWDIYGFGIGSRPLGFRQCGEGWDFQTARGQKCTILHSVFFSAIVHLVFSSPNAQSLLYVCRQNIQLCSLCSQFNKIKVQINLEFLESNFPFLEYIRSGRGRTKLGKEVVALRCVVEVVVEMKEEKGEIV